MPGIGNGYIELMEHTSKHLVKVPGIFLIFRFPEALLLTNLEIVCESTLSKTSPTVCVTVHGSGTKKAAFESLLSTLKGDTAPIIFPSDSNYSNICIKSFRVVISPKWNI